MRRQRSRGPQHPQPHVRVGCPPTGKQIGGELTVHEASELRDEVPIPKSFDGAAVALRFGELR